MKFDIIEYLGKIEDGALLILTLNYEDEDYEASFYYKNQFVTLTVDEAWEEIIGCEIERWKRYNKLVLEIVERVVPYNEIINTLDEIDLDYYFGEAKE